MNNHLRIFVESFQALKFSGASNLAKFALNSLINLCDSSSASDSDEFIQELLYLSKSYMLLKPSRAPLENGLNFVVSRAKILTTQKVDLSEIKKYVRLSTIEFLDYMEKAQTDVALVASKELKGKKNFLTICKSSTIINCLDRLNKMESLGNVFVMETRPNFDGRITARELGNRGIKTTLIIDNAAQYFISKVDGVLSGADIVFHDGSILNKIGTRQLAILSKVIGIPFLVLTSCYTFLDSLSSNHNIIYRSPEDVIAKDLKKDWINVEVINPPEDITENKLIHKIITDRGVYKPFRIASAISEYHDWISSN